MRIERYEKLGSNQPYYRIIATFKIQGMCSYRRKHEKIFDFISLRYLYNNNERHQLRPSGDRIVTMKATEETTKSKALDGGISVDAGSVVPSAGVHLQQDNRLAFEREMKSWRCGLDYEPFRHAQSTRTWYDRCAHWFWQTQAASHSWLPETYESFNSPITVTRIVPVSLIENEYAKQHPDVLVRYTHFDFVVNTRLRELGWRFKDYLPFSRSSKPTEMRVKNDFGYPLAVDRVTFCLWCCPFQINWPGYVTLNMQDLVEEFVATHGQATARTQKWKEWLKQKKKKDKKKVLTKEEMAEERRKEIREEIKKSLDHERINKLEEEGSCHHHHHRCHSSQSSLSPSPIRKCHYHYQPRPISISPGRAYQRHHNWPCDQARSAPPFRERYVSDSRTHIRFHHSPRRHSPGFDSDVHEDYVRVRERSPHYCDPSHFMSGGLEFSRGREEVEGEHEEEYQRYEVPLERERRLYQSNRDDERRGRSRLRRSRSRTRSQSYDQASSYPDYKTSQLHNVVIMESDGSQRMCPSDDYLIYGNPGSPHTRAEKLKVDTSKKFSLKHKVGERLEKLVEITKEGKEEGGLLGMEEQRKEGRDNSVENLSGKGEKGDSKHQNDYRSASPSSVSGAEELRDRRRFIPGAGMIRLGLAKVRDSESEEMEEEKVEAREKALPAGTMNSSGRYRHEKRAASHPKHRYYSGYSYSTHNRRHG
ncbi:hypothetical protein BGZ60DRAFT_432189 [Tricladium varicosporioides]|nr:hypothetical protein BGZ60DRAFT_432189 [Hymenoscyphus varicosporioides]